MKKANVVAVLHSMSSIAKLASKHGIVPLKKLGQNFIFDESLCDRIIKVSQVQKGDLVLEIGAGPAGLTRSILKTCPEKLIVIETDKRCISLLEEVKTFFPALEIKHADALKVKLTDLEPHKKINIISNLPYNIGSVLLVSWLHQVSIINSMTLMLQKEVVDRLIAQPGTKSYGRLSVICQLTCDIRKCFNVSPKAFYPEPKVWSSVVRLIPKKDAINLKLLLAIEKVTNIAFSGRRKMIKSSFKPLFPNVSSILDALSIKESLRAENLTPAQYLQLAEILVL